ncbi:hypothetical protein KQX64_07065 [Rhodopseudomonas palustris]|nr:hypothetical protein KQX64_07065 [Rhodopseudomonas palustris]
MTNTLMAAVHAAAADEPTNGNVRVIDASAQQIANARAEGVAEGEKKGAAGVAEAVKAERNRCAAIITSEAAKGREDMARYVAFETDMSADQAIGMLGKAPQAAGSAPAAASPLDRAMAQFAGKSTGADAQHQAAEARIDFAGIYASYNGAMNIGGAK